MSNIKKVFIISSAVLIITLLFWAVSFFKTAKIDDNASPKSSVEKLDIKTGLSNNSKIIALSDEAVISATFMKNENFVGYYSKDTGKNISIDINGARKITLRDNDIPGLADVFWSPDRAKTITKTVSPSGEIGFYYYNYDSHKEVPLKKNLDNVAWQFSSSRIFYKFFDPRTKERTLNTADPDGSNWKKLADLKYRDVSIAQVPGSSMVSFWNKPDAFSKTSFESMPISGGQRKTLFSDKFGADYLWSSDGKWALVSHSDVQNGSKMQLAKINQNGGEYKNLDFPTFVSKCAWSKNNDFIFCSLPGGMPEKAILPNDYDENKFSTVDTFWKVNVKTGEKTKIELPGDIEQKFDAKSIFINSEEKYLFFTNKVDGKLYRISL